MNAQTIFETLNPLFKFAAVFTARANGGRRYRQRRRNNAAAGRFPMADAHTLADIGLNIHKVSYQVMRRSNFE